MPDSTKLEEKMVFIASQKVVVLQRRKGIFLIHSTLIKPLTDERKAVGRY